MTPGEYHPSETQAQALTAGQNQKPAGIGRHQSPADEELLFQFRKGEDKAFKTLFNNYYKPVLVFASRILGDICIAEDIAAEAFYSLYHHRLRFETLSHIRSFLFLSARNACLNSLKAQRRRQAAHGEIRYLSTEGETPQHVDEAGAIKEIAVRLHELPQKCCEIFQLIFHHSKTTREVATQLGISEKNVINQKLKAIKILKRSIKTNS